MCDEEDIEVVIKIATDNILGQMNFAVTVIFVATDRGM